MWKRSIDNDSLYQKLGHPFDLVSCLANWPTKAEFHKSLNRLLLLEEADFLNDRRSLFVCGECGDLGCGAISIVVEESATTFSWRGFGHERSWDNDIEMFNEVGVFVFDKTQYLETLQAAHNYFRDTSSTRCRAKRARCAKLARVKTTFQMHKTRVRMDDERTLTYYDFAPQNQTPPFLEQHQSAAQQHPPTDARLLPNPPEMRWNPTLGEWTVYAASRMSRPMLPSKDACPMCPGILELPLPYQVAIFENRAPSMAYIPGDPTLPDPTDAFELVTPARGRCDIVVYSQQHDAKMFQMPTNEIACLVEAWRSRYEELVALPEIKCVSIFENKGREAGMTLDHPHGQIYSFPFLPPTQLAHWKQTQLFATKGDNLWNRVLEKELRDAVRIIAQTDGFLAAMPRYARYPYEVHIWAKRDGVHSLLQMTTGERGELAAILKNITSRYEKLWPNSTYGFPTLMMMNQLSNVEKPENYRFHIELLPLQRSLDKLKYRASVESGTGTFLNDALPEMQAAELREIEPKTVELPTISFA